MFCLLPPSIGAFYSFKYLSLVRRMGQTVVLEWFNKFVNCPWRWCTRVSHKSDHRKVLWQVAFPRADHVSTRRSHHRRAQTPPTRNCNKYGDQHSAGGTDCLCCHCRRHRFRIHHFKRRQNCQIGAIDENVDHNHNWHGNINRSRNIYIWILEFFCQII